MGKNTGKETESVRLCYFGYAGKISLSREQTPEWYLSKALNEGREQAMCYVGKRVPFQTVPPASVEAKARGKEAPWLQHREPNEEGRWEQWSGTRLWQGFQILFLIGQVGKCKTPLWFMVTVIQ